jgi:hypothetical protein
MGFRSADLISTSGATDIHGSKFDSPSHPIATGGVLSSSIVPAKYVSFVSYVDSTQLARFGLHNGTNFDGQMIGRDAEILLRQPLGPDID